MNPEKYCQKIIGIGIANTFQWQYWYWYWQYFFAKVFLLVLTILLTSIVNIPECRNCYFVLSVDYYNSSSECKTELQAVTRHCIGYCVGHVLRTNLRVSN